jgi:hypothetical protein
MLARLRRSIKTVEMLFTRHLAAITRESDLAHERRREYDGLRTTFLHIAQLTRIAARDGKIDRTTSKIPRVGTIGLLSHADAVLGIVSPHADILEDYGLPAHVLHDMPRRLAAFKTAESDQYSAKTTHVCTNDEIRRVLREGDDAVVGLEASLRAMPGGNPTIVAELREAKRVGRRRSAGKGRRKSTPQPPRSGSHPRR